MSVGEALACSAVSASHSASGGPLCGTLLSAGFGSERLPPGGGSLSQSGCECVRGRVGGGVGGLRRQGKEDAGAGRPSLPL